jgi:molybdopterin-guanine dinucleotide biosynthesis protein A
MSLSAVLLAGGESRRMGKDKATILFRGKPLWEVQLDVLRKLDPTEILLSARNDPSWRPVDVQFVGDVPPSRGPLSGLAASLVTMRGTHLLALAIDMPAMAENYLRVLREQIGSGQGVIPRIDDRFEPLAAIYPREVAVDFRRALASTDFSLRRLVSHLVESGKLRVLSVAEHEKKFFLNVNEISDLAAL